MAAAWSRLRPRLARHLPTAVLALAAASFAVAAWQLWRWREATLLNRAYASAALKTHRYGIDEPELAYAVGTLLAREGDLEGATRAFATAELSPEPGLKARALFALGNLQFTRGLKAADVAAGGSHLQGLAEIDLAREAFKGALRLEPGLHDARYNLELLDRLSPPKRVEGWERSTDGVTLAPQKRDGWASMKDNVRRGLP